MNKARYIRTSTLNQNEARQLVRQHEDEQVFIDKISGAVPFDKRPQAKILLDAATKGDIQYISVSSIDRLGRSTIDVLQTLECLTKLSVVVKVDNLGLESMVSGKENPTFKLIVSVLANISEMERTTLRERQLEGIAIAKLRKGVYNGRVKGTPESREKVIEKYSNVVKYLKKDIKPTFEEIAKLCDCSKNTVQKVKKILLEI